MSRNRITCPRFSDAAISIATGGALGEEAAAVKEVCEEAGERVAKGQLHHGISKRIHDAMEKVAGLAGRFFYRDSRLTARAVDALAHRGYQRWHIHLDAEVVAWLRKNPSVTEEEFLDYMRALYERSDIKARFPGGLEIVP